MTEFRRLSPIAKKYLGQSGGKENGLYGIPIETLLTNFKIGFNCEFSKSGSGIGRVCRPELPSEKKCCRDSRINAKFAVHFFVCKLCS